MRGNITAATMPMIVTTANNSKKLKPETRFIVEVFVVRGFAKDLLSGKYRSYLTY